MKALLSVSNKKGLEKFAAALAKRGYELYGTSGTAKYLSEKEIKTHKLSEITGFSELASGRVKTLNEKVFEMILSPDGDIFDIVVVNLYPFESAITQGIDAMVENFDIGGVALLRAAAKNYKRVAVISSFELYDWFLKHEPLGMEGRRYLAKKAMETVVRYDTTILENLFDSHFQITPKELRELRYGENPHQRAWVGKVSNTSLLDNLNVVRGDLSYNNYVDLMAATKIACACGKNGVVVVKHTNPCGASKFFENLTTTFERALSGDSKSAYGGVLCVNGEIDEELAKAIKPHFWDLIIARKISQKARELFKKKKASLVEFSPVSSSMEWRIIDGVALIQEPDEDQPYEELKCMTSRKPTLQEIEDVKFGLEIVRYAKSNAVILVKNGMLIGLGAGQPSRVDSTKNAIEKANEFGHSTQGAVMVSDGFFPFSDAVELGLQVGVKCFVEPGGSKRDAESIEACEKANATMVFTSKRVFKH